MGTLLTNGEIVSTSANAFRMKCGDYGVILRNDGTHTYLLITAKGDPDGGWNDLRPLCMNNNTGKLISGGTISAYCFEGSLIGNASTATKLATARTISITGGSTGSATFDGSADASISVTNKTLASSNYGTTCISYFQGSISSLTSALSENDSSSWNHFLIFNHGNGKTYFNVILDFPFHNPEKTAFSQLRNGTQFGWNYFHTTANVLVQTSTPGAGAFTNQIWLKPIS